MTCASDVCACAEAGWLQCGSGQTAARIGQCNEQKDAIIFEAARRIHEIAGPAPRKACICKKSQGQYLMGVAEVLLYKSFGDGLQVEEKELDANKVHKAMQNIAAAQKADKEAQRVR